MLTRQRSSTPTASTGRPRRLATLVGSIALAATVMTPVGPASAATIPNAPSGLAAQVGSGVIGLAWADNSSDEGGFEIERCTATSAGCTFAPLASVAANQYLYSDTSPTSAYRYRVRAVNSAGASAWSAEAALPSGVGFATYPVAAMTATPTSGLTPLTVTFDGTGSHGIDFTPITNWSWSFGDGATATGTTASGASITASHVYTTTGTFRATLTVYTAGSLATLTATSIAVSTTPPGTPTNLTATSPAKQRVDLKWTNPATTNATSLVVSRCTGATCTVFSPVATLAPTATSWSNTGLRSGTTYRYMVTAWNAVYGSSSNVVTIKSR